MHVPLFGELQTKTSSVKTVMTGEARCITLQKSSVLQYGLRPACSPVLLQTCLYSENFPMTGFLLDSAKQSFLKAGYFASGPTYNMGVGGGAHTIPSSSLTQPGSEF